MAVRDRDDACPGVVDATMADDGLIARVRLPGGRIDAARLGELAAVAREFGTGSLDLTARANVQLRGLTDADLPAVADALAAAGLLPTRSHDRVRNILASPLAGRDPRALVNADTVVDAIDEALCASPDLAALSGRFLIAVDDGGVPVATARQDITLLAVAADTFALLVAGHDTTLRVPTARAAEAVIRTARAFLSARASSGAWHVRELPTGAAAFAARLGGRKERVDGVDGRTGRAGRSPETDAADGTRARPVAASARRGDPLIGTLAQSDGRHAVGALVPLGRLTQRHVAALVALGGDVRITTTRGVVVRDVLDPVATVAALEAAGLPCDPASPWRGVTACSGLGSCRRASTDVRAAATRHALSLGLAPTGRPDIGLPPTGRADLAPTNRPDSGSPSTGHPGLSLSGHPDTGPTNSGHPDTGPTNSDQPDTGP
ncbi:precorrin-3B synthase, partial [Streptomyces sp. SID3343]|uniref:precorrin-3B synthase n=1 Tax=Streptomyces sp. SID3343 TaxID=2690260 RepID=UPI00136D08CB